MAYRDSTTGSGSSATPSVSVPSGVVADDIVILVAAIDSSTADFQTGDWPTGFTELVDANITADGHSVGIGWKRLTGSDAGSYTFGNLGSSAEWVCQAFAFSGRHTTNPPVSSTDSIDNTGNNTPQTPSANGVTAVEGDDLLWLCAPDVDGSGNFSAWSVVPTNFTSAESQENGFSNLLGAYRNNVSAGATGSISGEFTHSNLSGWGCWLIRIPAAGAAAGQPTVKRWGGIPHMPGPNYLQGGNIW